MKKSKKRLKPLSLHPLKPEEALKLFMKVKPEDIVKDKKNCKITRKK
jgi:hypothetical protein